MGRDRNGGKGSVNVVKWVGAMMVKEVVSYTVLEVAGFPALSSCTTLLQVAYESGVRRSLSGLRGLTSSRSNSSFTTPSRPFSAAHKSGDRP